MKTKIIVMLLIFGLALSVFAGGKQETQKEPAAEVEEKAESTAAAKYRESPMLTELVKAGKLEPVEERLPDKPLVFTPIDKIGEYGGTVNASLWSQPSDGSPLLMNSASLTFLDSDDLVTVTPALVERWEYSDDYRTLTIFLRKGTKWSDGAPFTVDDILFWYEDCLMNEEITSSVPQMWRGGSADKIDAYTLRFTFVDPTPHFFRAMGLRANNLQTIGDGQSFVLPKHYAKQFHIKYNPEAQKLAEDAGFDQWYQLLIAKSQFSEHSQYNPEVPVLAPWKVVEATPEYIIWERNPYFWIVDTEGNQLPYIDRLMGVFALDRGLRQAKLLAGEIDVPNVADLELSLFPELKSKEKELGYRVWTTPSLWINAFFLSPNQNSADPKKRELFQNLKFRQALSLALDRNEINEIIFLGLAKPQQPLPGSPAVYDEKLASAFIEHDPARANRLLDEIGLNKRNAQGFRTFADGSDLKIEINLRQENLLWLEISKVVIPQLREVGLDVRPYITSWSQVRKDLNASISDMPGMSTGNGAVINDILGKGFGHILCYHWGFHWRDWFRSGGSKGQEPPEWVKEVIDLQNQIFVLPDEQAIPLIKEGHRILIEHLPAIGTVSNFPAVHLIRDTIGNVNQSVNWGEAGLGSLLIAYPFQWFFEK